MTLSCTKWYYCSILFDRKLYGEYRRYFMLGPQRDFDSRYETPHFTKFNLNTMTERLGTCHWIKGEGAEERDREREIERERDRERER